MMRKVVVGYCIIITGGLSAKGLELMPDTWWERDEEHPPYSLATALNDVYTFGRKLMTIDSWAVLSMFAPAYGFAHMADKPLHRCFYCARHHKNLYQGSGRWHDASESLVGVSIGALGMCCFAYNCYRLQRTAQMYAITLPLTWAAKSLVKKIEWPDNCRPRHERYSNKKIHYGGFPSGHMLEMTYATVLFGLRMGPIFAVPLAAATTFIGVSFVRCNRHFLSQLFAGAAIGTMFGCASYWALEELSCRMPIGVSFVSDGERKEAGVRATYTF